MSAQWKRQSVQLQTPTGQQFVPIGWPGVWLALKRWITRKPAHEHITLSCYMHAPEGAELTARFTTMQVEIERRHE
jgi:hypothetical protein